MTEWEATKEELLLAQRKSIFTSNYRQTLHDVVMTELASRGADVDDAKEVISAMLITVKLDEQIWAPMREKDRQEYLREAKRRATARQERELSETIK